MIIFAHLFQNYTLMKKLLLFALAAIAMVSCTSTPKKYQSVNDYPNKRGSLRELVYSPQASTFNVWSPNADSVVLSIYADAETAEPLARYTMTRQQDGSWIKKIREDLCGRFYTFRIYDSTSRWELEETPGIFATAVGINGQRAAIIDMRATDPEGWQDDVRPAFAEAKDAIIYEMHHRDMSIHPSSGITHRGKFLALTEHGTTNAAGLATGIDHLVEMGITHVQILPSYDFGSIDERGATDNARVLESGAAVGGSYNWGYDPINYNVPEGSYSTNPADPTCRIRELKMMIQALHKAGIRVVMDVVYNHTYDIAHSPFTQTAPDYFYRMHADGTAGNASGCGNETASEREMMRRFIIESVQYWVEEYHMDGFRFDLMGIHDINTMNDVRAALNAIDPSLLLHGEGWTAGDALLEGSQLALKANISQMPGIAAFCDELRDALRGPFSDDKQGAFLAGIQGQEMSVAFGIAGCIAHPEIDMTQVNYSTQPWCKEPTQCIAYVSCHDDMMLTDRLRASVPNITQDEMIRLDKLAQTAILTSQGIPFIWCGEEIARDKKGVHNSFCSPDSINAIDWSLLTTNHSTYEYYRALIQLRHTHPAFRMGNAEDVLNHLHFPILEGNVVAYTLTNNAAQEPWKDIAVILNARAEALTLPFAQLNTDATPWQVALYSDAQPRIENSQIVVPAQSAVILHR